MNGAPVQPDPPFWESKTLEELDADEWEALCDGCGRCCLEKFQADDRPELYGSDIGCKLLDCETGACSDYAHRIEREVKCFKLTTDQIGDGNWLPPTCGYRRVLRREKLDWWHPLISGDPDTVRQAGISVAGRFIKPDLAGPWENHTVDWPFQDPTGRRDRRWLTAMFGGINASVPTPFGANAQVDLDLMAAHCLWLLANGCHGLAVLDQGGEVASLAIAERIAVLEGLAARDVPMSKVIAGIGPSGPEDAMRVAAGAVKVGIRGVMLFVPVTERSTPAELIPPILPALSRQFGKTLHIHVALSAPPRAIPACLTALEALSAQHGIRGIRDDTAGSSLGLQVLERFGDQRMDVYTSDDRMTARLLQRGGAGVISLGANLLGRLEVSMMQAPDSDRARQGQRMIESVVKALGSRPAVPTMKALLARHAGHPDWARVRMPLRPIAAPERASLSKAIDATGLQLPQYAMQNPAA